MHHRAFRRAAVAAFSLLIAASMFAFADTVPADGDSITPGNQTLVDLGHASPGDVLAVQVTFSLVCIGASHATAGSTIALTYDSAIVPGDGAAEATDTTISVPQVWAPAGCPVPAPTVPANAPSNVSITMPTTPGDNQDFTLMWARSGSGGLSGQTTLTFRVDVIGNTRPTIHLPSDRVVEATSAAGAVVTYSATATDAEDTSAPAVTCKPASGATFPIGKTTVQCSTKDSGGLTDSGSFLVTVVDTTAPVFANIADIDVTTGDPAGAVVDYGVPALVEAVDPAPVFGCAPASGSVFAVGTTTVTCAAHDATGNQSSMSFSVRVRYVPPVTWTAIWGEPVGSSGATFVANAGRTVPVKVRIFANGVEQTADSAELAIATCGGSAVNSMPLAWGGGRWNASVDTGSLGGPGCYTVSAGFGGQAAGSFRLDLRGADPSPASGGPKTRKS